MGDERNLGALLAAVVAGVATMLVFLIIPLALIGGGNGGRGCAGGAERIVVGPPGHGTVVAATVFDDRTGYKQDNLHLKPDSYAELGGATEERATLMGGLPYMTPLRITANGKSVIAFKRDIGYGQGPGARLEGHPYVIDLFAALAAKLGLTGSTLVRVERLPGAAAQASAGGDCTSTGRLGLPVRGRFPAVSAPFCQARAWESCHPGIDLAVSAGTPLIAAASGRVVLAGPHGGYGNYTCIESTSPTVQTCYAHQSAIEVHVGQFVSRGAQIGLSGCSGHCLGAHLHFEVRAGPNHTPTCPAPYWGLRGPTYCRPGSPGYVP